MWARWYSKHGKMGATEMKIERVHVYGFAPALRGMRNPLESWSKSDTVYGWDPTPPVDYSGITCMERPLIGPNDMALARKLIKAGSDHRKFLRQIAVWWDITAPRYIWQELDTYKVATVRNSCSTMHKLGHRDLTADDFQDGDVNLDSLDRLNAMGATYRSNGEYLMYKSGKYEPIRSVELLTHMKRRLPEGFLQMATYSFNYEVALNMYLSRRNHRMPEWSGPDGICDHLLRLPYFAEFTEDVR